MSQSTHAETEAPCTCLICKITQVIMDHHPGDQDTPIPPEHLSEMRLAVGSVAGGLLVGANAAEADLFFDALMTARQRGTSAALFEKIFGGMFTRR